MASIETHTEEASEVKMANVEEVTPATSNSPDQLNEPDEAVNSRAYIAYRVDYRESDGTNLIHQHHTAEDKVSEASRLAHSGPVFEVVTTYHTTKSQDEAKSLQGAPPSVGAMPRTNISIHSPAIINALQSVVKYYPGQSISGDSISIVWPYPILVHHEEELKAFRARCAPDSTDLCVKEVDAYEHLGLLLDFLERTVMKFVRDERERNARGFCTFDWLWVPMKPGLSRETVTTADRRICRGYVIRSVYGGVFEVPSTHWYIKYWGLNFDGTYLGRQERIIFYDRFDGESDIELGFDFNSENKSTQVKSMIQRGRKFADLLKSQCKYYKGVTSEFPHNPVDGLVMVDSKNFYADEVYQNRRPDLMKADEDSRSWITDCICEVCDRRRQEHTIKEKAIWAKYNYMDEDDIKGLTDHMCFLCPPEIWAFVFKTRSWECLEVDSFQDPKFEEQMIDNLVMDARRKDTLKALAQSYARINKFGMKLDHDLWGADFVQGKGHGLIFLLHGKPGVGKTCTAECIAAYARRPLLVLTSSDIGSYAEGAEINLTKHFKRARAWGAIILIDEADVFMERRTTTDLHRNSLVAAFLRALEFYDGILFLTTNRVGTFDDAFISRVHVQMYYADFTDDERRSVWQTFIDKLNKERMGYIRVHIEMKEYLDGSEIKKVKWNGREIRNAFQTAVALAEYDAEKDEEGTILVKAKHLIAVMDMAREFKDYLDKLHRGDEAKRAERGRERIDSYNKPE